MYALKGKQGHQIDRSNLKILYRRARLIAAGRIQRGMFDIIAPAPSSSNVPFELARRIARALNDGSVVQSIFQKPTVRTVLKNATALGSVNRRDVNSYKTALGIMNSLVNRDDCMFEAKSFDGKARPYLNMVDILPSAKLPHKKRILIVDDSTETGSTLQCCADLIGRYSNPSSISGLVILGPPRYLSTFRRP